MVNLERHIYIVKITSLPKSPPYSTFGSIKEALESIPVTLGKAGRAVIEVNIRFKIVQDWGLFSLTLCNELLELAIHLPKIFTQPGVRHF